MAEQTTETTQGGQAAATTQAAANTSKAGQQAAGQQAAAQQTAAQQSTTETGQQQAKPAAFLTAEQAEARERALKASLMEEVKAQLASEFETKWRKEVAAPRQKQAKIDQAAEKLQAAGIYLPRDKDKSHSNPSKWGALAKLELFDDTEVVYTDPKTGETFTLLDLQINDFIDRARENRKPKQTGADALGTPPVEPGGDDFLDKVADDARKERESKRSRPTLADVYGGFAPAARR